MHEHHTPAGLGPLEVVYTLANLAIFAAYIAVPFTRMGQAIPLTNRVRVAGGLFFLSCAFTHATMAFRWSNLWLDVAVDVVQACAAWYFVVGFSSLLAAAEVKRRRPPVQGKEQGGRGGVVEEP